MLYVGLIFDDKGRLIRVTDAYKVEAELLENENLADYSFSGVIELHVHE